MEEKAAQVLYISTSVTAKAENCETVRAGMGVLVDGKCEKAEAETGG
jgi:hypothetical protein